MLNKDQGSGMAWTAVYDEDHVIEFDLQRSAFLQETIKDAVSVPLASPECLERHPGCLGRGLQIGAGWHPPGSSLVSGRTVYFFATDGMIGGNRAVPQATHSLCRSGDWACRQGGNRSIDLSANPLQDFLPFADGSGTIGP